MKVSKIKEVLSNLDNKQEVYIQIGDNAYPATVRVFVENGKHIPYITIDNTNEHRNFPESYGCKEVKQ